MTYKYCYYVKFLSINMINSNFISIVLKLILSNCFKSWPTFLRKYEPVIPAFMIFNNKGSQIAILLKVVSGCFTFMTLIRKPSHYACKQKQKLNLEVKLFIIHDEGLRLFKYKLSFGNTWQKESGFDWLVDVNNYDMMIWLPLHDRWHKVYWLRKVWNNKSDYCWTNNNSGK